MRRAPGAAIQEIEAPARLPADEAELAEWSVYADALLEQGDPRGELLALELALPAAPAPEALEAWRALARPAYRERPGPPIGWCLAHARTLDVAALLRARTGPSITGTAGNVRHLVGQPTYARVEWLSLALRSDDAPRPWRRMCAALPPSCRCVELDLSQGPSEPRFEACLAALPPTVRELDLRELDPRWLSDPARLRTLVTDRFDIVGFPDLSVDELLAQRLSDALAQTRTVQVRVPRFTAALPWERCVLGRAGDAALLRVDRGAGLTLVRPSLGLLQRYQGPIPVRAQLAGGPIAVYRLGTDGEYLHAIPHEGGDLIRRGSAWTLHGSYKRLRHNGSLVPNHTSVPVLDGDVLTLDQARFELALDPTAVLRRGR